MTRAPDDPFSGLHAADGGAARRPAEAPILGPVPVDPGAAGARFRRAEHPVPEHASAGAPTASPAEVFADASRLDAALAPTGATTPAIRDLAAPLAALAAAFQANAEALRRSHELQADLGRALQRADRSEALVQNTTALNETFKGLTHVQRSLLHQVDETGKAARAHRWLLPFLVLAGLAVMGGGLWLVVERMNEVESDSLGRGDFAAQLVGARREGEAAARGLLEESLASERRTFEARLAERDEDLRTLKAELATRDAAAKRLEGELSAAANEISGARADSLRARALESDLLALRAEQAVKGPEAERLRLELEQERRTVADLRRRLADVSLGRLPSAEDPDASRPPPPKEDPGAVRDRRVLETARARLNEVLDTSAQGRSDSLQVTAIGAVSGLRLADVTAVRYGAGGKAMSTYKAREARITVDRARRVVELTFADGTLEYAGSSVPFPGGTATVVVAEGDGVGAWIGTGLTFVGMR